MRNSEVANNYQAYKNINYLKLSNIQHTRTQTAIKEMRINFDIRSYNSVVFE